MKKTFAHYINSFFHPESTEINIGAIKFKFSESIRKDAMTVLSSLKAKRVLFANTEHELWMFVFQSLKNINAEIIGLNSNISYKGPNDLSKALDYIIESIAYYLSEYETDYIQFMALPNQFQLGDAHRERNWPLLGEAARSLILLRKVIHYCLYNLNEFAYKGRVNDWEEPNFHAAEYWSAYADDRKLCPKCGWNLLYSATGECPNCFDGTVFKLTAFNKTDIYIAGTFNNWSTTNWKMAQETYGHFIFQTNLPPGKYHFKFIVDGEWTLDPYRNTESDSQGNINSVLIVE